MGVIIIEYNGDGAIFNSLHPTMVPTPTPTGPTYAPTAAPSYGGEYCLLGVLNIEGTKCCPASCGTCGGAGCAERPGGWEVCCTGSLTEPCLNGDDVACVVPDSAAPVVNPTTAPTTASTTAPTTAPTTASTEPCPGPFDGYPECESKVAWSIDNRPSSWYEKRGLDATRCSVQGFFSLAKNGAYCPSLISEAPIAAPVEDCPGPFDGYPKCESKVTWSIDNRPSSWYEKRGLDATRCSVQGFFSLAENGAYCPAP